MARIATAGLPSVANPIRVMIVDDSAAIRGVITKMLESEPGIAVVSTVPNGQVALSALPKADADVVVLDIEMPVMDGLTTLPKLLSLAPDVRVIMASTLTQRGAEVSFDALRLGAADYL